MLKLILCTLFLFIETEQLYAQQKHKNNTVYVTVGAVSRYNLELTAVNNIFETLFSSFLGTTPQLQHGSQPVIGLGYQYRVAKNVNAGIEIVRDKFWLGSKENNYTYNSLLLRGDYVWLSTKHIDKYSGLGIGISTAKTKYDYNNTIKEEKNTIFGWHFYTVGIDCKLKSITLCGNFGYGASGIINGGIKYSF